MLFAMDFVAGFVGIGTINSAVIRGLSSCDIRPKEFLLSPRSAEKAEALRSANPDIIRVAASNQEVLDGASWIFVATPPGPAKATEVLEDLKFREDHVVVSFIAGISPSLLQDKCAPATELVQAFPLPPAEEHQSTTVMVPRHTKVEALLAKLGSVIPVDSHADSMKIAAISCVMGDFYAHQRALHQWLVQQGIESGTASSAISSYFNTFNHASLSVGPEGFDGLVAEQTPGGMNEQVIAQLTRDGNYGNLQSALTTLLPRLLG